MQMISIKTVTNLDLTDITAMRLRASEPNSMALGYPVNREHAFKVDLELLGIKANSMTTTYLNNIASPYYHGGYTTDNIKDLEVKLIELLGKHFNIGAEEIFGYTTYGGTEANFVSLWWHRNYLFKHCGVKPLLICSAGSHYSLRKIADQLDLELIEIEADYGGINCTHLESVLQHIEKPVIFSANFGATVDGSVDDVILIKSLLDKYVTNRYKIHGDGAIYGLFIPYLNKYKNLNSIFDLIDTLSISGHKFLGAYNISGIVLSRKSYLVDVFVDKKVEVSYVQNAIDITSSGSRQGLFSLELYLLLERALEYSLVDHSKTNLEILWNECLDNAKLFYSKIIAILGDAHPLLWYNDYQLSILIPTPKNDEQKKYLGKKYGLMPASPSQYGIYVFPRSTNEKLDKFLSDYKIAMSV